IHLHTDTRCNLPVVVHDPRNSPEIDAAMPHLPALPAEAANPARCRSYCQRNQEQETEKADSDKGALGNVFPYGGEIERLVGAKIGEEVETHVEKGEESKHAAETDEIGEVKELAEGRNA